MLASLWRQGSRSLICPETPRLDGQRALVTGGSEGVGLGTCGGLLQRGARVIMASRSAAKCERACAQLRGELGAEAPVSFLSLDLSDLSRVREAVVTLATQLGEQRLDVLICNAGLWPRRHDVSPQGHELAFATNVLGHFLLLRHLIGRHLASDARVVIVTGDIYILASDCTPDYPYRTQFGGMLAYCRSKLGNLWLARELQRRHPDLQVRVVHPGVVATSLGGERKGLAEAFSRRMLLDVVRGAQTTLYCVTQTGLPDGAYVHNVRGIMKLSDDDPASDGWRAARLWEQCEVLCRDHLHD
jgi:NAD(P)-dependent dehydrogenase (short-subunit alcohol dehydrogenase family)